MISAWTLAVVAPVLHASITCFSTFLLVFQPTSINIPPTLPWPCTFLRERKCRLIQGPELSPGRGESPAMGVGKDEACLQWRSLEVCTVQFSVDKTWATMKGKNNNEHQMKLKQCFLTHNFDWQMM